MSETIVNKPADPVDSSTLQKIVLLVDDQAMIGEAVRRQLSDQPDLSFHYCSDPAEAISLAARIQPTVILQDLVMPGVDGLVLVREFRQHSETKNIPVIVLSTKEDPAIKSEAFASGANDYLVKLPDKIELIARIRYHSQAYLYQIQLRESQRQLLESHKKLEEIALHDPLTKLLNRSQLEPLMQEAITRAKAGQTGAILYLDLDNFKTVNDTLGHSAGDRLLINVTALLHSCIPSTHSIIRFGGDEFVVIFKDVSLEKGRSMAEGLRARMEEFRFTESNKSFRVNASIGLALIDGELESGALLAAADSACYSAKAQGRNRVELYRPEEMEMIRSMADTNWAAQIKEAMQTGVLQIWFQPIVSVSTRKICCEEVLVRYYDSAQKNMISPTVFLRAVERSGQAVVLDRYVIQQAFKALADHPSLVLSINLMGPSFADPTFPSFVEEEAKRAGIEAERVMFEITESVVVANVEQASATIDRIQKLGCRVALDDFGSSVSSLVCLKNLPVKILKMDGSFVRDLEQPSIHRALVRAIQEVGDICGIETVATHVENEKILQALVDLKVTYAQGYYFSEPLPHPTMGRATAAKKEGAR
jgi:diguanylate cyclase (GGDEF)-like protein